MQQQLPSVWVDPTVARTHDRCRNRDEHA